MPRPRPPSRVDTITFPVFGLSWFGSPGDGTSIVAYCGGGGSAKTGVVNKIVLRKDGELLSELSTGDEVCVSVQVYQNPITSSIWLIGAIGNSVVRYALPSGQVSGQADVGEGTNAIAVNAMADRVAVGCESGAIHLFKMDDKSNTFTLFGICEGHVKAVCSLAFSLRGPIVVSSAKDGTARVWNYETQTSQSTMTCDVQDPKAPPSKRPQQVLVRGCAFGDLEGNVVFTVASARRGKAFLCKWVRSEKGTFECAIRTDCSPVPISAMSLSSDAGLLALGGVDGTVTLYDTEKWKVMRKYTEIHDLPVTCIAARPYAVPLQGEEDGIRMHAISASADSQLALLTLQKRAPKKASSSNGGSGIHWINTFFWVGLLSWVLYYVAQETLEKCEEEWNAQAWGRFQECLLHTVLIAPESRSILVPPH
jgi:WD40 repeat protein